MPQKTVRITPAQLRWFRLRRSGLIQPFASAEEAATRLIGIQAQIRPAAALALHNRTPGLTHAKVDELLYQNRSLVKLWGQRGTLHLYASREWPLIRGAFGNHRTRWERDFKPGSAGWKRYEAHLNDVIALLRERKEIGRNDLRTAGLKLPARMYSSWGGIFAGLVYKGYACHAEPRGPEGRFAAREHWLPEMSWNPPSVLEANAEFARRYFRAYGPATARDFTYWRGALVGDSKAWVAAGPGPELVEVECEGQRQLALREDLGELQAAPPERDAWPVHMLYRFDPLLLAHRDKSWVVPEENYRDVWRPAGHIEGVVLEHGTARGVWRYDWAPRGMEITVSYFKRPPARLKKEVEKQATTIARFFGTELAGLHA